MALAGIGFSVLLVLAVSTAAASADGEEQAPQQPADAAPPSAGEAPQSQEPEGLFERLRVVSAPIETIPGSVDYLDEEHLGRQAYADVHRVLSQVPGVNVQDEEGYGLRPNIGMRGTGVERSQKITVMEDGVLIAPAPYSAPSAYYFPTIARMAGVEVRKGSSAIRHGPFTNGGVLNLISSAIPSDFGGEVSLAHGDNDTLRGRARLGDTHGRLGWLVEAYRMETEGFKQLDGGGDTGFELSDVLAKLRVTNRSGARRFQALELKLGRTVQDGRETYLGLTQADFERNPFRRYAASAEDAIESDHDQVQARYLLRASRRVHLTLTAYRNDFFRNWRKLDRVRGVPIADVFDDPVRNASELDVLRGADSVDDALVVRNNRRDYFSHGLHAVVGIDPAGGRHDVEVGVRYHEDEEDRFQEEDGYRMSAGGRMVLTSVGAPGSQSNRISSARALALFVQDTVELGRWTVTPGVRFESIRLRRLDFGGVDPLRAGGALASRTSTIDELIPGVGVTYRLDGHSTAFAGVHRGFAPPGPGAAPGTDAESSVNWELGYRRESGPLRLAVVGFLSDYENLLGADTLSSGGTGDGEMFNGGEVMVRGLEASVGFDAGAAAGWDISVPIDLAYTATRGEFENTFRSEFEPWGDVTAGDELPYLAPHQGSLGMGLVGAKWSAFAHLAYSAAMRTEAGRGPVASGGGTDSHAVLDLSVAWTFHPGLRLFVQMRNATDERYVAARRPAGARPGLDRTTLAGVSWEF